MRLLGRDFRSSVLRDLRHRATQPPLGVVVASKGGSLAADREASLATLQTC